MLNKKLLAAAITAAISMNVNAAQDLNDPATVAQVVASEFVTAGAVVVVTNGSGTDSDYDIQSEVGFSIADGTSKYVRIELTNAVFQTAVTAVEFTSSNLNAGFAISQGGALDDNFVVVEVSAVGGDIQQSDTITMAAADFEISQTATATAQYSLHDSAVDAVNGANALDTASGEVVKVASITSGDFVVAGDSIATVASGFTDFDPANSDAISATVGQVGSLDTSEYLSGAGFKPDGTAVVAADLITAGQNVTVSGDFSFGTWKLGALANCGGDAADVALTANADEDGADPEAIANVNLVKYLCVTVNGTEVVNKGSYTISLDTDELTNTIGTLSYDTTSIEVPYLTTFSSYNQRVYMTNSSSSDASYSITFISEDGVTATAGTGATGTIPAGEMISIKATDIVTLTGKTRTAATIEVEAEDSAITAATQSVNLSNGGTDTTVLN